MRIVAGLLVFCGCAALLFAHRSEARAERAAPSPGCPAEMVGVQGFCIDRWEIATVDKTRGELLSPYYPPDPDKLAEIFGYWTVQRQNYGDAAARALPLPELPAWQREHAFEARAVSRPGVVPQGYLSYYAAKSACENSGKRLCTKDEWQSACKGAKATKFPYGADYRAGRCNVYRMFHPAAVLHENSSLGHRDPRLNLIVEAGKDPLLRPTGATPSCASEWSEGKLYDMVGNLDEWVEADPPEFVGGFYARMTTQGCEAKVSSHAALYYDYSTGARCCRNR
ncbi:MAG TPA: SUMF1/EgtB/PvdO family nonheme iron enzyme [Polyangiaceae bacterium]|nr:SUMF1/EgtB/PvdO family nonheme iron enzyme [Polyangiaceae bacterium]